MEYSCRGIVAPSGRVFGPILGSKNTPFWTTFTPILGSSGWGYGPLREGSNMTVFKGSLEGYPQRGTPPGGTPKGPFLDPFWGSKSGQNVGIYPQMAILGFSGVRGYGS